MRTGLLWNTYVGDIAWFRHSAASFTKFAKGQFNSVACFVPTRDRDNFRAPCEQHGITLLDRPEWEGKGFNFHQFWQCQADLLMPDVDAIWHMDSDTVFTAPCKPQDWMLGDKIIKPYTPFEILLKGGREGPWQWKSRIDDALGGDAQWGTMTGHPHAFFLNTYRAARELVKAKNPSGFEHYLRRAQNSFPQGFCEFETLGTVALRTARHLYHWQNLQGTTHPSTGLIAQCYSHGGLNAQHDFGPALGGMQSPQHLFDRLGI
jgi:hypothetical protein